ncbi:PREDICTED: inositol hexakisphosphate and diphosphoinositol-pentakisphosphate kinase 2 [Tinamus guttatus]|uniref:inositol hexakisphosphate and diphosphoinositol-pentakisphosphate kinase 2 n=1 Tax=Tinamus guttatus TaxID=94827 RepID=UPI00052EEBB8|nr:PREDICTED: inositol hexakisphosphate and diphosphoinositol-pentakisphosphate kinase 2 [Tinamus guttatus]
MVPSICPLETLHNSLSLKQVDEFLASVAAPSSENLQETSSPTCMSPLSGRKSLLNTYTPAKILPTPLEALPERLAVEKIPTSTSGSAGCETSVKLSPEETSHNVKVSAETLSEKK